MKYEVVMGLEVHVELATKSKIFCACSAEFGAEANQNVCPACAGMPGLLPVTNRQVVELAIRAGLVTNCQINSPASFDKKNYFYPDLSNSYQITQLYAPICTEGAVEIKTGEGKKSIGVKQIHMEEDAGKLIHQTWLNTTLVDFNRCSVPLCEIVSKPDFRTAQEVIAYLEKLRSLLRFAKVSQCRMEQGSMRCDVNISVREKGSEALGVRTEIKNMNSLSAIERAIAYESQRHIDALESGKERLIQETRRWDEAKNMSFSMRSKETEADYRYFPDPNLVPIIISPQWIENVRQGLPEMAELKKERYIKEFGLPEADSEIIAGELALAQLFDEANALCNNPKEIANWLVGDYLSLAKKAGKGVDELDFDPAKLARIISLLAAGDLNRANAKKVFGAVFNENVGVDQYIAENKFTNVSDDGLIGEVVNQVIAGNQKSVADYKAGKLKAIDYLFGQCMRQLKGNGDPAVIRKLLTEGLEK